MGYAVLVETAVDQSLLPKVFPPRKGEYTDEI